MKFPRRDRKSGGKGLLCHRPHRTQDEWAGRKRIFLEGKAGFV
jgi:hypothetical protein